MVQVQVQVEIQIYSTMETRLSANQMYSRTNELHFVATLLHGHCQLITIVCHIDKCKHSVNFNAMPVIFYRNLWTCAKDEGCPAMFDISII